MNAIEETIDSGIAAQILRDNAYSLQRSVSKQHVKFLADEMRNATFAQRSVIRIGQIDGREILLDGQHRLAAVVECDIPQTFLVVYQPFENERDVADMYTRIDVGRRRSILERYKTLELDTKYGLPPTWINSLGAAVRFVAGNFNAMANMHQSQQIALMDKYALAAGFYREVSTDSAGELGAAPFRASTMAVALVTYEQSSSVYNGKVDAFWDGVLHLHWVSDGDPRKYAYKHLLTTAVGRNENQMKRITKAAFSSRVLAACFNSWVLGQDRKLVRETDHLGPIRIEGTMFTGEKKAA